MGTGYARSVMKNPVIGCKIYPGDGGLLTFAIRNLPWLPGADPSITRMGYLIPLATPEGKSDS